MKKNDIVKGTCLNYTHEGLGVVKIDGFPLFVKGLLAGEEADIVVTLLKKTYGYGKYVKLHNKSRERTEPICPVAKQCGGCQLQHMSSQEQARFKKQNVQNVIERVAKLDVKVHDVISMEYPYHYRNKGQVPIGIQKGKVVCGFYRINSNDIIDMEHCPIQSDAINMVIQNMRGMLQTYDVASYFRHILVKHAFASNEVMVVFITKTKQIPNINKIAELLVTRQPEIHSVILNVNSREDNVILGEEEYLLYGTAYITDMIHDLKFHISSKSFYQVNPIQTSVLYETALSYAGLIGNEHVLDLYCGVGTISMFLAQKAAHVTGIEIVPEAVEDAKKNAALNRIENIDFICSDATAYAVQLTQENKKIDVVVVDPPRKGCDQITLESIVKINPKRIVYVSCDPGTLARDLKSLNAMGYKAIEIQPVDMFPQTYHVETVCIISKK